MKLLKFLFYNVVLYDRSLSCTVIIPYKAFIEANKKDPYGSKTSMWCGIVDALQTSAIKCANESKLQELVRVFGLSGDLLDGRSSGLAPS